MKLVEILGKELKEWPEDASCIAQDSGGEMNGCVDGDFPVLRGSAWGAGAFYLDDPANPDMVMHLSRADDYQTAIVTRAQWQAERDRQKGGEWKRHRGNSQPVDEGTYVEVKLRCGDIQQGLANAFLWRRADCDVAANIMKYRVISQPQAEEVEVNVFVGKDVKIEYAYAQEGVEPEHLEWKTMGTAKIDSICDLGSTEAKTDQIDGPIRWRDTVNELDAYIEEFTREREALINRLEAEGFALIQKINVNLDKIDTTLDMSDWRNWKAGDIVECTYSSCDNVYTEGKHYDVDHVTSQYAKVADDCGPDSFCHINDDEEVKFRLVR